MARREFYEMVITINEKEAIRVNETLGKSFSDRDSCIAEIAEFQLDYPGMQIFCRKIERIGSARPSVTESHLINTPASAEFGRQIRVTRIRITRPQTMYRPAIGGGNTSCGAMLTVDVVGDRDDGVKCSNIEISTKNFYNDGRGEWISADGQSVIEYTTFLQDVHGIATVQDNTKKFINLYKESV